MGSSPNGLLQPEYERHRVSDALPGMLVPPRWRFFLMANVKKGQTVKSPEWWKHLKWAKRLFWKRQRKADKRLCKEK